MVLFDTTQIVRLTCLLIFLYTSLNITWSSCLSFLALLGSIYFLPFGHHTVNHKTKVMKTKEIVNDLYPKLSKDEEEVKVTEAVLCFVMYDVENTDALYRFERIKENSNCLFAKKAKIWGSPPWNEKLSLEENIYRLIPMFLRFTIVCQSQKLDGFLIELPGDKFGSDVMVFASAFRRVLQVLSDHDPSEVYCMDKSYLGKRGWVFEFNKCTFFITTFAPFYPESHPRYAFGCSDCYILFQPEISFALHDLPSDSTETNWLNPTNARDKIRVAFRQVGRGYDVPQSLNFPMSHDMIRPISVTDPIIEWWIL
ncbi:hypothetical protein ACJMK2_007471 [Sinanodonta woodiana]|uniref:Uncharacterized protein n=1 Tax=Sinanodonta woodiana TaxID=1069815 RepID=A0ABD3VIN0_SINWO